MPLSSFSSRLRSWEPKNAPEEWLIINALCCGWSLLLFLVMMFATDDSAGKKLAKAQYIVYDLLTTVVWVFQTSLTAIFDYDVTSVEQWIECAISLYFLGDSAVTVYKWRLNKQHTIDMEIATFVAFLVYLYATKAAIRDLKKQRQDSQRDDNEGFLPAESDPTEETPLSEKAGVA